MSTDQPLDPAQWPTAEDYGDRFDAINKKLERSLAAKEYSGTSLEEAAVLRYRLAKLAMAAEDIRRAIALLEQETLEDEAMAKALVELRNACTEVAESFADADPLIVRLLNYASE